MQRSRNNTYCCVPQCNSQGTKTPPKSFHRFPSSDSPSEIIRRRKWIWKLRIGKQITKRMTVCSKHFKPTDYFFSNLNTTTKVHRLKKNAIPSQCLPLSLTETVEKRKKKVQLTQSRSGQCANRNKDKMVSTCVKDAQSSSEDTCVIASMYVVSDDKGGFINVESKYKSEAEETAPRYVGKHNDPEKRNAIEAALNEYLKKRYLIDYQKENRNLQNSIIQTKNSNPFVISLQSYKENCASNKQVPQEINPRPVSHAKRKQVQPLQDEILPHEQQNLKSQASASYVHPPSNDSNQTMIQEIANIVHKTKGVQVNSIETNDTQKRKVYTLPSLKQKFNSLVSASHTQPVSNESIGSCAQEIASTVNNPQTSQLLPIKIEKNALETDNDCDMFAARIAEELKRMKNPCCRAQTQFNIEKILIEAKSGIYDT